MLLPSITLTAVTRDLSGNRHAESAQRTTIPGFMTLSKDSLCQPQNRLDNGASQDARLCCTKYQGTAPSAATRRRTLSSSPLVARRQRWPPSFLRKQMAGRCPPRPLLLLVAVQGAVSCSARQRSSINPGEATGLISIRRFQGAFGTKRPLRERLLGTDGRPGETVTRADSIAWRVDPMKRRTKRTQDSPCLVVTVA